MRFQTCLAPACGALREEVVLGAERVRLLTGHLEVRVIYCLGKGRYSLLKMSKDKNVAFPLGFACMVGLQSKCNIQMDSFPACVDFTLLD